MLKDGLRAWVKSNEVFWIAIEGVTLQLLRSLPDHLGYSTLFSVTIVYYALGTLVIRQVKGVKYEDQKHASKESFLRRVLFHPWCLLNRAFIDTHNCT